MARTLSPFTRLTLLISELNNNKLENLLDKTKCDLVHHTEHLADEISDVGQKESATQIAANGKLLFSLIQQGEFVQAETERQALILACKKLKDLV